MLHRILALSIVALLSFAGIGLGNTLYYDIYGKKIQKIGESANKITVLYFDVADDDTKLTELESVRMRLKQLAVAFQPWKEVCTIIVVTPSKSLLPGRIKHLLPTNQDIYVNKCDELWAKYHRGPVPAAMIDFEPGMDDSDPKSYVPFVSGPDDPEGAKAFQHLFLPKKNTKMTEMLEAAIKRRLSKARNEGDLHLEKGRTNEARASYSVARSWLDHLSNPVEGFDPRELASGYLDLGNHYIRIAGSGKTQSNPQTMDIDKECLESEYLAAAKECLEKALRHEDNEATRAFYTGLTYEYQEKLEDARSSYKNALLVKSDWAEVKSSLVRVEEKIRRILLCVQLEASFHDDLPEKEGETFTNGYQQMLLKELIERGYRVRIIPSPQKEEFYKLIEQSRGDRPSYENQNGARLRTGRIIYGKVTLTIRRFRPISFNLIMAEGSIQIHAATLGNTGVFETFSTSSWRGRTGGNGETDTRAVENFFEKNSNSLKEELNRFLDKLSKPEEYVIKGDQG